MRRSAQRRFWQSGFSLIEVVVATGLCTYALVIIACLLPMGLGTVQVANTTIVETELFNRIWLEVNTVPFYDLPSFQRFTNGTYPDGSKNLNGLSYFDKDGGELGQNTNATVTAAKASAIYYVYCTLNNPSSTNLPQNLASNFLTRLPNLGPQVDGMGTSSNQIPSGGSTSSSDPGAGTGITLVQIQIGFHFDPSTMTTAGQTDPRVATRSFVIAKRDTSNGN